MPATTEPAGEPGWQLMADAAMSVIEAGLALGTLGAYPGHLHGKDVVILAIVAPQEGAPGSWTGAPIAVLCTDEILADLEVRHATTVVDDG